MSFWRLDLVKTWLQGWWAHLARLTSKPRASTPPTVSEAIGADDPIHSASEDRLRRGPLAKRIADVLSSPYPYAGRVFAIRAEWGVGKSSLKNLVIGALKAQAGPSVWLEFNPWQWGENDAISRALFLQMGSKLKSRFSPEGIQRARLFRRYSAVLLGAGGALKGAGDEKFGLLAWVAVLGGLGGAIGLQLPGWLRVPGVQPKDLITWALLVGAVAVVIGRAIGGTSRDPTQDALDAIRADLERRLRKLKGPLIVFVDDIDRLEPEQIRSVIRQVKANANLPNIVFVLLFQPSIVIAALDEISDGSGNDYLDKIVQANFDLPIPSRETLMQAFGDELAGVVDDLATEENGFQQVRWGNVLLGGIQPFLRTLRDTRRLISSIAIHVPLHRGPHAYEVNLIDLLGVETLRVFEPALYRVIGDNKTLLLQSTRFPNDGANDRNRADIEAMIALASAERRATVRELLIELFPTISSVLQNRHFGNDVQREWLKQKRVCSSRMFDRYFELQVREGELSESDFQAFVNGSRDPTTLDAALTALYKNNLLPSLATRLDEGVDQLPLENIGVLLPAIFELGGELKNASDGPFNSPYISSWRAASWLLRRVPEAGQRSAIMEAAMQASAALAVPAVLISLDADAREKGGGRELLFDGGGFARLKALWVDKVRAVADDGDRLVQISDLVSTLYRWRDFAGGFDEPRAWVQGRTKSSKDLVDILAKFVSIGRAQSVGDRVAARTESFERRYIEDFFDLEELERRLSTLAVRRLTDDTSRLMGILAQQLEQWRRAGSAQTPSDSDMEA